MKLVPLGDKIVLKTVRKQKKQQNPESFYRGQAKEKTAGGRSNCSRTWWKYKMEKKL